MSQKEDGLDQAITIRELTEALKSVRIWARHGDSAAVAWQMKVLHPADAARDIAISVGVKRWSTDAMPKLRERDHLRDRQERRG